MCGQVEKTTQVKLWHKYKVITQIATCIAWWLNTLLDDNASVI